MSKLIIRYRTFWIIKEIYFGLVTELIHFNGMIFVKLLNYELHKESVAYDLYCS